MWEFWVRQACCQRLNGKGVQAWWLGWWCVTIPQGFTHDINHWFHLFNIHVNIDGILLIVVFQPNLLPNKAQSTLYFWHFMWPKLAGVLILNTVHLGHPSSDPNVVPLSPMFHPCGYCHTTKYGAQYWCPSTFTLVYVQQRMTHVSVRK